MIRPLTQEDIPQLVPVHIENSLAWSHNARLGEGHVTNIYRTILTAEESFGFGYFTPEGRVVSFITATTDYFATMKKLYALVSWRQYGALLAHLLRHPGEAGDLWEAKFVIPRLLKTWDISAFLLTWHNNFKEKDTPVAAVYCMQKTLAELKKRGCAVCTVQVDAQNERPNAYYRSIRSDLRFSSRHNNIYEIPTV